MKNHVLLIYNPPLGGGANISWETLMNFYTYERDALAIALSEIRKKETEDIPTPPESSE